MRSTENGILDNSYYFVHTPSNIAKSLFLYPLFTGYFYYSSFYTLERNSYDSFLIMLVKKGTCSITLNQKEFLVKENQCIFLDCYQPHAYKTETGWEAEWIHFDGIAAKQYYELITKSLGNVISVTENFLFQETLHKIYLSFYNKNPIKEILLNKQLTDLLSYLLLTPDQQTKKTNSTLQIEKVTSYINSNLTQELSLDSLAQIAGLSGFYFTRVFKKAIGFTPHDYLIEARLNHARFLLRTTELSVKEICFHSGFSSECSFCSTFKKREGITPSEYRFYRKNESESF